MKKKVFIRYVSCFLAILMTVLSVTPAVPVHADTYSSTDTGIAYSVEAVDRYINWDAVSNVAQFLDESGNYCFAYDGEKEVTVVRTKNGKPQGKTISLKKQYPLFGNAACDSKGNFYLVTGRKNTTNDRSKQTIFISKYDKNGKLLKTVGDNGSSSLGYWYPDEYNTKEPFWAGCCDIAVNGNYLAVFYSRRIYSDHQCNSAFAININTMKKVSVGIIYSGHSFAQRVIPYKDGFLFASEGDCFNRAFTINAVTNMSAVKNVEGDSFHFWVKKGTYDAYDMSILNNNFAHMGAVTAAGKDKAALVGTSAKSLSKNAQTENEQLFIQIFDPTKNLSTKSAFVTSGTRSGYGGKNGDEKVTDYGVKWLTSYSDSYKIDNPQAVSDSKGNIVILYELYKDGAYKGVYYMVVNPKGKVITKKTCFSSTARLNSCQMPVCKKNAIYWTGNAYMDSTNTMYVYKLKIE